MKFSKIAAILKKSRIAILFVDKDGMQWLSDGTAIYKLKDMPDLDEDTVLTVMGVADNQKDKWHTSTRADDTGILADRVYNEEEITAEDAGICIIHNGKRLVPIYTCDGMLWIDAALMAPLERKEEGYRRFFLREIEGKRAIAVKDGLILTAIILEVDTWRDTGLSDRLKNLVHCIRAEEFRRTKSNVILEETLCDEENGEVEEDDG